MVVRVGSHLFHSDLILRILLRRSQDFMLHSLRNCYVVVMNARDESSSFSIFSTLNGRGMDLSVVDKLKADLLQVRALETCAPRAFPALGPACVSGAEGWTHRGHPTSAQAPRA